MNKIYWKSKFDIQPQTLLDVLFLVPVGCWARFLEMAATGAGSTLCCIPDRLQPRSVFSSLKMGVGGWVQKTWNENRNFKALIVVNGPLSPKHMAVHLRVVESFQDRKHPPSKAGVKDLECFCASYIFLLHTYRNRKIQVPSSGSGYCIRRSKSVQFDSQDVQICLKKCLYPIII